MASHYWLHDPRFERRWRQETLSPHIHKKPSMDPKQSHLQCLTDLYPGGKAAGEWV